MTPDEQVKEWTTSMLSTASMAAFAIPAVGPVIGALGMLSEQVLSMLWRPKIDAVDAALQQAEQDLQLPTTVTLSVINGALSDLADEVEQLTAPNLTNTTLDTIVKHFQGVFADDLGSGDDKLPGQMHLIETALLGKSEKQWLEVYEGLALYTLGSTTHLRIIAELLWYDTAVYEGKVADSEWYGELGDRTGGYMRYLTDACTTVERPVLQAVTDVMHKDYVMQVIMNAPNHDILTAVYQTLTTPAKFQQAFGEPIEKAGWMFLMNDISYDPSAVTGGLLDAKAAMATWSSTLQAWAEAAKSPSGQ